MRSTSALWSTTHETKPPSLLALLLLTEDRSKLYIWCLSAITMWFGGLELSFIYERHIALQEGDNIFKWVKRVRPPLRSRRVTKSIRCPCVLSDCVEEKWSVLDLCFLFWRGDWCGDFLVILIKKERRIETSNSKVRKTGAVDESRGHNCQNWCLTRYGKKKKSRFLNVQQTGVGKRQKWREGWVGHAIQK